MLKIYNEKINEIVKIYASRQLLDIDGLVIAGGFATFLYHLHSSKKSAYIDNAINNLKLAKHISGCAVNDELRVKFSDIDYWVIKDSQASILFGDIINKFSDLKAASHPIKNDGFELMKSQTIDACKQILHNLFETDETKKQFDIRISMFAVSLVGMVRLFAKQQIIMFKAYDNIQDIFNSFDINICKVAWKDGWLYVDDFAKKDFDDCSVILNFDFSNKSLNDRIISSQRVFKYNSRYMLSPSPETIKVLQGVYIDAIHYLNQFENNKNTQLQPGQLIVGATSVIQFDSCDYFTGFSEENCKNRCFSFVSNIHHLLMLPGYTKTDAAFLLGENFNSDHQFKNRLKEFFEL